MESEQDVIDSCETWLEAAEQLTSCVSEFINAIGMANRPRIRETRRWVAEALGHETDARDDMLKAMGLKVYR